MDYEQALANFRATHGPNWYMFINSQMWQDARKLLSDFGPNRKLAGLSATDVLQLGTIIAANIQGWQSLLVTLEEELSCPFASGTDTEQTYANDSGDSGELPPPAPLAPVPARPARKPKKPTRSKQ